MDEFRIYNQAIPTSQVQESYYSGLNRLLAGSGIEKQEYTLRIKEFLVQK
jgi:hypothetical protein